MPLLYPFSRKSVCSGALATLVFCVSITVASRASAQTIDTTPLWNNTNGIDAWAGDIRFGGGGIFGQTFVAPASATTLTDFLVYMRGYVTNGTDAYVANLFEWDTTNQHPTGTALFSQNGSVTVSRSAYRSVLTTINAPIVGGKTYVFYLTPTLENSMTLAYWGYLGDSAVNGADGVAGNFVMNNIRFLDELNTTTWKNPTLYGGQQSHDIAFRARFSSPVVVPESPTFSLALPALGMIGAVVIRRRKSA